MHRHTKYAHVSDVRMLRDETMATNQELSDETRRKIVETFWDQAYGSGIRKVNIRSLMTEVGMNRSTFYEHFDGIGDLIRRSEDELLDTLLSEVSSIDTGSLDRESIPLEMARILQRHGRRIAILLSSNGDPLFFDRLREVMGPTIFDTIGIRCEPDVADRITRFTLSAFMGVITECMRNGYDEEVLIREFLETQKLVFNGVRPYTESTGPE